MLYDIPDANVSFQKELLKHFDKYDTFRISSKSLIKTGYPKNDINQAILFLPSKVIFNTPIILLHGMGERNLKHLEYFGHKFASLGFAFLIQILPFHYERKDNGLRAGEKFLKDDMDDSIRDFRQAVIDARVNLNYLESLGFGNNGFNLIAFSFGGMVGTILMGVDERIKKGVFVVTGGNYEYITWKSLATRVIRKKYEIEENYETYGCNYDICREIHKDYEKIIENIKSKSDIENYNFSKGCFLFDPLTFAPLIKGRETILIRAIFDEIFPKESTFQLAKAMGSKNVISVFSDHYSIILYRKKILNIAYNFFVGGK